MVYVLLLVYFLVAVPDVISGDLEGKYKSRALLRLSDVHSVPLNIT